MNKNSKTKVDELRDALKRKHESKAVIQSKDQSCQNEQREEPKKSGAGEDLSEQIRAAEEEAKNHYDKLLRVMAEFENFKKRMSKERDETVRYSNEKLLSDLLPSLDDLDRVLDHVPPDAADDVKQIADGIELMRKSLFSVLERHGLKEVPALGELFDPSMHEAIATVESDFYEPGHVMAVHRKGFWLNDRLIRPAMVTVAKDVSN